MTCRVNGAIVRAVLWSHVYNSCTGCCLLHVTANSLQLLVVCMYILTALQCLSTGQWAMSPLCLCLWLDL